ncbi:MAG: hypothetical protein ACI8Y8_002037 [Planctomycetota bacterium]|jgi:hypothetical protein
MLPILLATFPLLLAQESEPVPPSPGGACHGLFSGCEPIPASTDRRLGMPRSRTP